MQEERTLFFEQLKSATQIKKNALAIDYVFKKRWVLNSVMNFSEVLKTPNVLMENNGCFRNKQAILIAAGPSLDLEIENLRRIKEEKLAYLFSVGSAISTLIEHGIYPDAMCTYDPQGINQKVFEKVYTSEITSIPMIFGSSVGFETLERYQGPKFHMITSQDTVSKYFLKMNDKQALLTVADAPSIAVMTFELLQKLGFEEIILVGQNLAFKDEAYYAGGIDYGNQGDKNLTDGLFEVMDVSGKNVLTNESLNRMRKELEGRIAQAIIPVINTTVGGAAIEGTNFQRLEEVMKRLNLPFEINEFSTLEAGNIYDVKFLISALLTMKNSYETYKEIIISIKQIVIKTDELMLNKNLKQSEAMYDKIDHLLNEFEKNQFAAVFEIPMHRVEHELLAVNLHRIKRERTGLQKIREQITYLDVFINQLLNGFETDAKIMMILEKAIRDYEMKLTKDSGVEE
ncbi:motility associated factor glycosyltransferase family protein [Acetobacterium malicum]|uniref:motility associated factor glycosyltransferase family protein n=1 Tax=Acetobacterium malicum TaxID=52692 RepID=UPI00146FB221|nr:6-hydroxymethylpterin diphosphokinase MptE-like protein [Acetobacterium dehalogenans]